MKVIPKEKNGHHINLSLKTVEENPPTLFTRDLVTELEKHLGLSKGRLLLGTGEDRAHHAEKGLCIYAGMPTWGV